MGSLGVPEMILLFILALVLFGPKKLPEIGRTVGKAITEFRRASTDLKATFEKEMQGLEQETRTIKDEVASTYQYDTQNYDYSSYDGYQSHGEQDSTAASTTTESASAPEGAEPQSADNPEHGYASETTPAEVSQGSSEESSAPAEGESQGQPATAPAEQNR